MESSYITAYVHSVAGLDFTRMVVWVCACVHESSALAINQMEAGWKSNIKPGYQFPLQCTSLPPPLTNNPVSDYYSIPKSIYFQLAEMEWMAGWLDCSLFTSAHKTFTPILNTFFHSYYRLIDCSTANQYVCWHFPPVPREKKPILFYLYIGFGKMNVFAWNDVFFVQADV